MIKRNQASGWFKNEKRQIVLITAFSTLSLFVRATIDLLLIYLPENRSILLLVAASLVVLTDIVPVATQMLLLRNSLKPRERCVSNDASSDNMTQMHFTNSGYSTIDSSIYNSYQTHTFSLSDDPEDVGEKILNRTSLNKKRPSVRKTGHSPQQNNSEPPLVYFEKPVFGNHSIPESAIHANLSISESAMKSGNESMPEFNH